MSESAWLSEVCGDCGEPYRTCICGGAMRAEVRYLRNEVRLARAVIHELVWGDIVIDGLRDALKAWGEADKIKLDPSPTRTERPCPPS